MDAIEMGITIVFKGGPMNGTEITYQNIFAPEEGEVIFVKSNSSHGGPIEIWVGRSREVYKYVRDLQSWVYDHESKVIEEE